MLSCCVLRSWTSYSSLLRSSWRTLVSSLFTRETWEEEQPCVKVNLPALLVTQRRPISSRSEENGLFFLCEMFVWKPLNWLINLNVCTLQSKQVVLGKLYQSFSVYISSIPSSWCVPACVRVPGGSRGAGTLCRPSQASPDRFAQCSPPSGSHLNTQHSCSNAELGRRQRVLWPQEATHTCWAGGRSSPCCCVWNT